MLPHSPPVAFHTIDLDLRVPGIVEGGKLPTQQNGLPYDTCSILSQTEPIGTSFGTGVITVAKSNRQDTIGTAVTTISTETLTELTGTGWFKAGYLIFHVSTVAGASVKVRLTVRLARLGFSV